MDYNFAEIEEKWQQYWKVHNTFATNNDSKKPKYYVLDMFPYPSGSGLHVGHPLGYIASDIYARYKRQNGFNVLHPMGYDAYGLPTEQYAIQTGQHPKITTEKNIARYRKQLDKLGFSYDWKREVCTCDPFYYKWTQWVFIKLFHSWYNNKTNKAEHIDFLIKEFERNGNIFVNASNNETFVFTASEWKSISEADRQMILMNYRLVYLKDTMVNWCPALGTVLANDEVIAGLSVRGGNPVVRKSMKQWSLRITAYSERLLSGLNELEWSESIKEIQRNWIGKSEGCSIQFKVKDYDLTIEIFTTRPDTVFGTTYLTLAPEHEYVLQITTPKRKALVEEYIEESKNRSERERMADVKHISGKFTGAYAINPFTKEELQIWVSDYVLAGYGTGAVMAVPAHDSRDYVFAKYFGLPIKEVISGGDISVEAYTVKEGIVINSEFITDMQVKDAIETVITEVEKINIGQRKINYRLRDAIFSRQRYWGEPIPIYYKNGIPYTLDESELPLELPEVDAYLPAESGEPPLARAKNWKTKNGYSLECNTMPGFAGSSAYYIRYMEPWNDKALVSKEVNQYWHNVDLYIGGSEHATGHLIYSRFWNKFLFDIGIVCDDEPFKKLINQGMIQGKSAFSIAIGPIFSFTNLTDVECDLENNPNIYISKNAAERLLIDEKKQNEIINFYESCVIKLNPNSIYLKKNNYKLTIDKQYKENWLIRRHVPVDIVSANDELNLDKFKKLREAIGEKNIEFILEDDEKYICHREIEKMSKSYLNVINPDDLVKKYGADTLRLYEMFLGPLEQAKPWDTNGIEGVFRFIRKLWKLYHDKNNNLNISDEPPTKEDMKVLHKTIIKVHEDIEKFSFNTIVSSFMICVNELTELKCNKRDVLRDLTIIVSPFAPHIAEELWGLLRNKESIAYTTFPKFNAKYIIENTINYPISFNGKMRFTVELPADMNNDDIKKAVLSLADTQKWLQGSSPKKVIIVHKKIVNIVM